MSETLLRQWTMLRRVPREPRRISTRELWQHLCNAGYQLSKRTAERDLNTLSSEFGLTCVIDAGSQYWFWPQHAAVMDLPGMDASVALAFTLAREQLASLLPASTQGQLAPWFAQADAVLSSLAEQPLGGWKSKVMAVPRGPVRAKPLVPAAVHSAITDALLQNSQLQVLYTARGKPEARPATLNPLGLVAREGLLYLVATDARYAKPQPFHYALHRFAAAECLAEPATTPPGFTLQAYVQEQVAFSYPHSEHKLKLVADFDAGIAPHLAEQPLAADQTLKPQRNGRTRCTATVDDTAELRWWLLGFGNGVEVRGPAALRREWLAQRAAP